MYCQSKVDNNKKHCKTKQEKQHFRTFTFVSQHFRIWPPAAILNLRKKTQGLLVHTADFDSGGSG